MGSDLFLPPDLGQPRDPDADLSARIAAIGTPDERTEERAFLSRWLADEQQRDEQ